jgi:flagellar motor protein MotB
MKRRHLINVWPAFADLMTVLAVCGLFTTLAVSKINSSSKEELLAKIRDSEQRRQLLEELLRKREQEQRSQERQWANERDNLQRQVREAARNEKMFRAIQEAQRLIDAVSTASGLSFSSDQSLQFGDDLVAFKLNSIDPIWQADSRDRLRKFCASISNQFAGGHQFVVQVEGHTDSIGCPGDRNCNWAISSGRAANFVAFMRRQEYCPGGDRLLLRPVGFADTKPVRTGAPPSRRIAVRLLPDYEAIISNLATVQ